MKKMFAVLLMLALVLSAGSAMAADVSDLTFTYDDVNHTAEVTKCKVTAAGDLEIPKTKTRNGVEYNVTSIGKRAFDQCKNLVSVTIPSEVTSIGEQAFYACYALKNVTIPDSVTSIGVRAFAYCKVLESITIPENVTSIGDNAFAECLNLKSITIPEGVTSVGAYVLRNCTAMKTLTFCGKNPPAFGGVLFSGKYDSLEKVFVPKGSEAAYIEKLNAAEPSIDWERFVIGVNMEDAAQPADLPKTGDSSSLALWLALLTMAGAGMMMRRREA